MAAVNMVYSWPLHTVCSAFSESDRLVGGNHPLGARDICTEFYGEPSTHGDILPKTENVNLLVGREEKSDGLCLYENNTICNS